MGKEVIRTGKMILSVMLFFSVILASPAQGDTAKKAPPGTQVKSQQQEKANNGVLQNKQDEPGMSDEGNIQDDKRKNEDGNSKQVKEVKSTKPDMNKSKGARPPYISRPSGTIKPQGAGKPGGAIRPGRR